METAGLRLQSKLLALVLTFAFSTLGWSQEGYSRDARPVQGPQVLGQSVLPHAIETDMPVGDLVGGDYGVPPLDARRRTHVSRRMQALDDVDAHAVALLPYAALAAEVYCDSERESNKSSKKCDDPHPGRAYNWRPLKRYPNDLKGPHDFKGMVFSTHYRVLGPDEPVEIAVAFRGTNFSSPADWHANLRWFLPGRNQYDVLAERVHEVVQEAEEQARARLLAEFGEKGWAQGFRWVSTGHSLGGGLAQLFAYKSSKVQAVVAFDSSPVTGFHSCVDDIEVNCNVPIWRVYQRREVLAYVRSLLRQVYSLSENITEVEINLLEGGPLFNHDITLFHKTLAAHMAQRPRPPAANLFVARLDCSCMEKRRPQEITARMKEQCAQLQAARLEGLDPLRWAVAGAGAVDQRP